MWDMQHAAILSISDGFKEVIKPKAISSSRKRKNTFLSWLPIVKMSANKHDVRVIVLYADYPPRRCMKSTYNNHEIRKLTCIFLT